MNTTHEHLLISDIKDDIVILKKGGGALILQVSAVNFGLLSGREQMAIIFTFAQMINSLSFSIQIVIHSERLNISSYLTLLDKAKSLQTNELLSKLITNYRQFIQTTIKENEVLDKKFYVVVPLFSLELGLTASKEALQQKIKTVLLPRRDQIKKQLARVGLKADQLTNEELVKVFYNIYNGPFEENITLNSLNEGKIEVSLKAPEKPTATPPPTLITHPSFGSQPGPAPQSTAAPPPQVVQQSKNHPFVVEELE